jgi:SAM-dependent methyltransferase
MYDDRYGYPGEFDLRRCRRCGHHHLDAAFSPEALSDLYSRFYPRSLLDLDAIRVPSEVRGFSAWLQGEKASAFRWVPPQVKVLDVGCGFGEALLYHRARGCEASGIEADSNILRVAERFDLDARVGLFTADQFKPASFDYVTLDQVVEHSLDPVALLIDVAKVLKPGGAVILSTPNSAGAGARVFGRRWINWHAPYHLQSFTRRSIRHAVGRAGLETASVRTITNSAWAFYQACHLFSVPPRGHPSAFWDAERAGPAQRQRGRRPIDRLDRVKAFHAVTRLADGIGVGDNLVCVLRKPPA